MASIPHLYSDEYSDITPVIAQDGSGGYCTTFVVNNVSSNNYNNGVMLGQSQMVNSPIFHHGGEFEGSLSETEALSRFPVNTGCFTDQFGVNSDRTDAAIPCSSNSSYFFDHKFGFESNIAAGCKIDQNNKYSTAAAAGFQLSDGGSFEYGDECCTFVPNFKSLCPELAGDNWEIQCNKMPAIENNNIKIGRYTVEERKDRILRYLKKRNQRNFKKTIKYACRKTLADRRVRVRGRFARNNELSYEDETEPNNNNNNSPLDNESYSNNSIEMKNEDDEWLQEAVASLMCVPYITG